MNLLTKLFNYFRSTPSPEDLRDIIQEAVDESTALLKFATFQEDEIEFLQETALMKKEEEELVQFLTDLGNRILLKPCAHFDKTVYGFRHDLAALSFDDYIRVSNCIDAGRALIIALAQDQINTLVQEAIIQYLTSPEGKKASTDIILSKAIMTPVIGDT